MNDQLTPEERRALAENISGQLAKSLATPEPEDASLQLYAVDEEIAQLVELRDQMEAEGETGDALAVVDKQITEYFGRILRKDIDGICNSIRAYEAAADRAREEENRFAKRAAIFRNRADRLREATKQAMLAYKVKVVETPSNKLRIQGNGGKQPLDILSPELIPLNLAKQTVTLQCETWEEIGHWLGKHEGGLAIWHRLSDLLDRAPVEPDGISIRIELQRVIHCPECKGVGDKMGANSETPEKCPRCEGQGIIPNQIPGVRLLPRGVQLRMD